MLPPPPASYVPSQLRFPVLAILSLTVSSALYAATSGFSSGELATVSRHRDEWWEIAGVLGFKVTELAVGWYGDYDSMRPDERLVPIPGTNLDDLCRRRCHGSHVLIRPATPLLSHELLRRPSNHHVDMSHH